MEEVAAYARELGRKALVFQGDVSQEEVVEKVVAATIADFGHIDVLVNNTGIEGPNALLDQVTRKDWDEAMAVNLTSAFLFCKHVVPHMRDKKQGSIINLSSLSGTKGLKARSSYCATK